MPIIVQDYQPHWAEDFQAIRAVLWPDIKHLANAMEHVGSTSVVGLAAKPIIDIDIIIEDLSTQADVIAILAQHGYKHRGDLGIEGRQAFAHQHDIAHNLYVCLQGCAALNNHLRLRDHLRTHSTDCKAYGALKKQLAVQHAEDIDAYVEGKTDFILSILRQYEVDEQTLRAIEEANLKKNQTHK